MQSEPGTPLLEFPPQIFNPVSSEIHAIIDMLPNRRYFETGDFMINGLVISCEKSDSTITITSLDTNGEFSELSILCNPNGLECNMSTYQTNRSDDETYAFLGYDRNRQNGILNSHHNNQFTPNNEVTLAKIYEMRICLEQLFMVQGENAKIFTDLLDRFSATLAETRNKLLGNISIFSRDGKSPYIKKRLSITSEILEALAIFYSPQDLQSFYPFMEVTYSYKFFALTLVSNKLKNCFFQVSMDHNELRIILAKDPEEVAIYYTPNSNGTMNTIVSPNIWNILIQTIQALLNTPIETIPSWESQSHTQKRLSS